MKYLSIIVALVAFSCSSPQQKEKVVEEIISPAEANSEEPTFFKTAEGNVGLTWLVKAKDVITFEYAVYRNEAWSTPKVLVSGKEVLTNWADFPGIQTNGKYWIAWFLQINNPDTFAYDIMVMQSSDKGSTWTVPKRIHSDSTLTEHGFVSAVPATNGFQLMWLDGRLATEDSPIFTVRSAHVDFKGAITNRTILDDNTCTCCQTSMLNTGDDNFIAFYRDRTEEEIRDIAAVNFTNSDLPAKPQIIYNDEWHIPGCPVNGPRAVMNGEEIGVAWFTMGTKGVATVNFSTSTDKGKSYSVPILIDSINLGRVDVLANKGSYYVSFMDKIEEEAEIKIVEIKSGKVVNTHAVGVLSVSRKTGFPRMALAKNGKGIYVAYVDVDKKQVAMKYLAL